MKFIIVNFSAVITILGILSLNIFAPTVYSQESETGVNYLKITLEGGLIGKNQEYTYNGENHVLTFIDLRSGDRLNQTLDEKQIDEMTNLTSKVLTLQLYDPVTCPDCESYVLSYIFTDIEKFDRFSGVGLWQTTTSNKNAIYFNHIVDLVQNIMNSPQ